MAKDATNYDDFVESLLGQVRQEISDAEDYLDSNIRPNITENWEYYQRKLPKVLPNQPGYIDNTCQASVDHYVAACLDAFTSDETLEIVPEGTSNPVVRRVMNAVVNDVLDNENNRFTVYQAFFKDAMVSGASVLKPFVKEETIIDKQYFNEISPDELSLLEAELEMNTDYDDVKLVETERKTITVTEMRPAVAQGGLFNGMGVTPQGPVNASPDELQAAGIPMMEVTVEQTTVSGYFVLIHKEKTIKIEQIPAENFLINKDAKSIKDARMVGHKTMVTISSLLDLGFDYDKVSEVMEKGGSDDDADANTSTTTRRNLSGAEDNTSVDRCQREVELYEIYLHSTMEETYNDEEKLASAKLYQIFYTEGVLLDQTEVDLIPYCGSTPNPTPFSFWGQGVVDLTKHIQRAKSGLMRQEFVYNDLITKPRFTYIKGEIEDPRDLFNNTPGAGIGVKSVGAITPLTIGQRTTDSAGLMGVLDAQREAGTGISLTGNGIMTDVLKAGGSTISAQMVMSESQTVQKAVIQTLLETGIKPLLQTIYELLRENFPEWPVTIDDETMVINCNQWPRLREIRIKTPLGRSAQLEKAQSYMSLFQTLTTAQGEAAKLVKPEALGELLATAFQYQDIPDAKAFIASPQEIMQKDQLLQSLQAMTQQMQQMQESQAQMAQQMQELARQNQQLTITASQMAQKELELSERKVVIQEQESLAKQEQMADQELREQQEAEVDAQAKADKQALAEQEFALKQQMAEEEAQTGTNLYQSV